MSCGYFNYKDKALADELFGWTDRPSNVFEDREISELTWDLLALIHEFDLYASGDTCKEDYTTAKKDFKRKRFDNHEKRIKTIIDSAVADLREELYETLGYENSNIGTE